MSRRKRPDPSVLEGLKVSLLWAQRDLVRAEAHVDELRKEVGRWETMIRELEEKENQQARDSRTLPARGAQRVKSPTLRQTRKSE